MLPGLRSPSASSSAASRRPTAATVSTRSPCSTPRAWAMSIVTAGSRPNMRPTSAAGACRGPGRTNYACTEKPRGQKAAGPTGNPRPMASEYTAISRAAIAHRTAVKANGSTPLVTRTREATTLVAQASGAEAASKSAASRLKAPRHPGTSQPAQRRPPTPAARRLTITGPRAFRSKPSWLLAPAGAHPGRASHPC